MLNIIETNTSQCTNTWRDKVKNITLTKSNEYKTKFYTIFSQRVAYSLTP